MSTTIVTGGAGFIGCNFVRHLLAHTEDRVVVVDKLTYAGNLESLAEVAEHPRYAFVQADIADRDAVRALFAEHTPAAIVNFAAETHVDRSIDDPGAFVRTNVAGTFELLEAARLAPARAPGAGRQLPLPPRLHRRGVRHPRARGGLLGDDPLRPQLALRRLQGRRRSPRAGVPRDLRPAVVLTNCSNNYGPYQFPEKLIPLMILNAVEGRPLPHLRRRRQRAGLALRGGPLRGDPASRSGRAKPARSTTSGAGTSAPTSRWSTRCAPSSRRSFPPGENPALGSQGLSSYSALKSFVPDRPGHDRRYAIDASKVRAELGWAPRHAFEDGPAGDGALVPRQPGVVRRGAVRHLPARAAGPHRRALSTPLL